MPLVKRSHARRTKQSCLRFAKVAAADRLCRMAPFDVLARAELLDFASENNEARHVFGLRTPQIRSPAQSLEAFTLHETPSPPYTARAPRISGIDLFVMAITAPWPPP